jgi:cytochrome c oxidase cbb3-type subunit 2
LKTRHARTQRDAAADRSLAVVTVGGIVEIAPLFYLENTIEKVEGMRPYSPLELGGPQHLHPRRLLCLPLADDPALPRRGGTLRSLQPGGGIDVRPSFQWGSKRTGPDLARVGDRYSNEWHVQHLISPRSVVPESVMPSYAFLKDNPLDTSGISAHLVANRSPMLACPIRRDDRQRHGGPEGAG